jgi:hypothetical protein
MLPYMAYMDPMGFVKEPIPHRTRYILIDGSFSLKDSFSAIPD